MPGLDLEVGLGLELGLGLGLEICLPCMLRRYSSEAEGGARCPTPWSFESSQGGVCIWKRGRARARDGLSLLLRDVDY